METASLLAEQFLPEATAPLLDSIGDVLDVQALMTALELLGEALGLESRQEEGRREQQAIRPTTATNNKLSESV